VAAPGNGWGTNIGPCGRSIANSPAGEHVVDPQPDEVAAPELAVDRQIEHRKIASALLQL
jgi:hypothetical protein